MLSDIADWSQVLSEMARNGHPITPELVASTSPYTGGHILRFGQYAPGMVELPDRLNPQPLPFDKDL